MSFATWLQSKSEVCYVYPAVPVAVMFFVSVVTAAFLHVDRTEYHDCKSDDDFLYEYLLGQVCLYYACVLVYANLIFELVPGLKELVASFGFFILYCLANTAWGVVGAYFLSVSDCDMSYYYLSAINVALFFAFLILVVVMSTCVFARNTSPQAPSDIVHEGQPQQEVIHNNTHDVMLHGVKPKDGTKPSSRDAAEGPERLHEENLDT
mmetsp:Transcript_21778/g.39713  ORF Transcript_21778/g.39713 Transcript_21778/m.39713 type:complete len:208 (+) Transcript_21778:12-635(+)